MTQIAPKRGTHLEGIALSICIKTFQTYRHAAKTETDKAVYGGSSFSVCLSMESNVHDDERAKRQELGEK